MSNPYCLLVEIASEHAGQLQVLERVRELIEQAGGHCWAREPAGRIAGLEPGSVAAGMVIARFDDLSRLLQTVSDFILPYLHEALPSGSIPLLLAVQGLPEAGLPDLLDIPTAASVPRPPTKPRNVFLVVRGRATDADRMNLYRDVILPMHKERGGYYEVFALDPQQVRALSGSWTQQIFAISRWPSRAAAEDFWFSDRYQQQAIALRLGAGVFTVHLVEACE